MAMQTSEEYAKEGGSRCPNCLSNDVEGADVEVDNGRVYQDCFCLACNAKWVGVYKLTGYQCSVARLYNE
jgi:hypothetical protein